MKRLLGTSLVSALLLGLLMAGSVATVAGQEDCLLTVEPSEAPAGSQFVLSGAGYTPDRLTLQRESTDPVSFELGLGGGDSFEIPIGSKPGDEGVWRATVAVDETGCEGTATFRVTLQPTDMMDDLLAASGGGLPPFVYLLVVVGGFAAGTLVARYARAQVSA
jgi:hypothetical protein